MTLNSGVLWRLLGHLNCIITSLSLVTLTSCIELNGFADFRVRAIRANSLLHALPVAPSFTHVILVGFQTRLA